MKTRILFLAIFTSSLFLGGCTMLRRMQGDLHYRNLYYQDAIHSYSKVLEKKADYEVVRKLADCYSKVGAVKMAETMWSKIVESLFCLPSDRYQLGMALMQTRKYDKAKEVFTRYLQEKPDDRIAENRIISCDSILAYKQDSFLVAVKKLPGPLNNEVSNYSPAWYGDGIVFASERTSKEHPKVSEWTHQPYTDLYYARLDGDSVKVSPRKLEGNIDGLYHEGPLVFTSDMKTVYFTRNNYVGRKKGKSDEYVNNLKVYSAELVGGQWENIRELPFNSDEFSCGHPALSRDEQTLYFVSDQLGGFGGTDIWSVRKYSEVWGKPENAGPTVNTQGQEMFPWIGFDGTLYFASDGWPGLGGLDIFSTRHYEKTHASEAGTNSRDSYEIRKPSNLKYPINSARDDFGYILDPSGKMGYLSSNRDRVQGVDDIYRFEAVPVLFNLEGVVITVKGRKPVRNALVELRLQSGRAISAIQTDSEGRFSFPLEAAAAYSIHAARENMFGKSDSVSTIGERRSKTFFVTLELDSMVIGKPIVLNNIYYDYDKWDIRADAEPDLNHLVKVMLDNPAIYVELGSHTDCRGSDNYNEKLSQNRAQSAVDYIVAHGVSKDRIYPKGYGEKVLINNCRDEANCTEEEHQSNRRTEFKVVKMLEEKD